MMGCPLTEFVLETVIRDGLNELRLNPAALDDLFSKFTTTFFANQYGQDKIEEIKTYIQNNQIKIVHALSIQPTDMPCISVQLLGSSEEEGDQQFSNMFPEEDISITPEVYIEDITINSYDPVTGLLYLDSATDLSLVRPGYLFVDADDNEFIIGSGNSNLSGNKYINIGKNQNVQLVGLANITSRIKVQRIDRRMIRLRETILLGCHAANNVHLAKFIYYILVYIIKTRQLVMEARGLHLDKGNGEIFDREGDMSGENVFSRSLKIQVLTEFHWDQGNVNLIDCFDATIKASGKDENGNEVIVDPVNRSDEN